MDDKTIIVSLVSNAGLLLQLGSTKILLDAIWSQSAAYSSPPASIRTQWLSGNPHSQWCNADYIVFTHLHNDHFEETEVIDYLAANKVRAVWFEPQDKVTSTAKLSSYMREHAVEHHSFEAECGRYTKHKLNEQLAITGICTAHMGINAHESHNALLIDYLDKHILLVADAEFPEPIFKQALKGVQPDAVFLNPVHFYSRRVLQFVTQELGAKMLVVYHVPFAGEGNSVFRRMVSKKLPQISAQIPVNLLWNIGDSLEL